MKKERLFWILTAALALVMGFVPELGSGMFANWNFCATFTHSYIGILCVHVYCRWQCCLRRSLR